MKVTLIQPPMFHQKVHLAPNLGLASIAAVLEQDGVEVQIIDAAADDLKYEQIVEKIREFGPNLVGSGGQTPVSSRSLEIFRRIKKEVGSHIVTMAGGPHFTFTDTESLEACAELDLVVRGEAENTVAHLCQVLEANGNLAKVDGITWRNDAGEAVRNQNRTPIADIDALPLPAWHLFPVEKYHWAGNKMIATSSSRGCPFRCPYCITWKVHQGVRLRDPAKVVEEMVWVKKHFDHDTFFFQDDASFLQRRQMEKFLDALDAAEEKLYWYYETREDTFLGYRDLWPRMKKNGLFKIVFGLETPDPETRKHCGKKGYDKDAVEEMMLTLERDFGILVSVYLLFGLPNDTEESCDRLLEYAKELYPKYCSFVVGSLAVPFPGTEMYEELKHQDLLVSYNWDDYGFAKSVIKIDIPPEKLAEIFSGFWVGTYVRPKVYWHQFKNFFSLNRFRRAMAKQYVTMGREMVADVKKMKGQKQTDF
jgi:anaerobic magnesium-protoporphyrin IX monomethyl ester cyclase